MEKKMPFPPPTEKVSTGGKMGLFRQFSPQPIEKMIGTRRISRQPHRKILSEVEEDPLQTYPWSEVAEKRRSEITVVRQQEEICAMQEFIEENKSATDRMTEESRTSKEKVSALENQCIMLNKAKEIDVSTMESNASENSKTIHELRTELEKEQAHSEALKEKVIGERYLRHQITALTIKLQERDAKILVMEKSYRLQISKLLVEPNLPVNVTVKRHNILSRDLACVEDYPDKSQSETIDTESHDDGGEEITDLKRDLASREAKLQCQLSTLERRKMSIAAPLNGGRKGVILSLRKVTLLQEMLDASSRHLSVVLTRLEDTKCMNSDMKFLLSICDKSSLMQNHIKISLSLLETRLSNALESIRLNKIDGEEEADPVIQARFDQTLKSLGESEEEMKGYLERLKKDIDHQNIQVRAKDNVIEDLIQNEEETLIALKTLQSELDLVKSLGNYSSVNEAMMSKFRECKILKSEMEDKERIIIRLNHIIDEYRAQEDYA